MVIFDEQVTQQIIEAFNQRNLEPVLKFFAEDTVLHCPGKHQVAGDYYGRSGVLEFWQKQIGLCEGNFRGKAVGACQGDGHLVLIFDLVAQRGGKTYHWRRANHYLVSESRAHEGWIYESDQYAADEAFA
jgi:ketosteroid isomerase-like protein